MQYIAVYNAIVWWVTFNTATCKLKKVNQPGAKQKQKQMGGLPLSKMQYF